MGVENLDPAARALLLDPSAGPSADRLRAATELAPGLPAAQAGLARALLVEEKNPVAAAQAAFRSLSALPRHLEASLWLAATATLLGVGVAIAVGVVFILFCTLPVLGSAGHDLGEGAEDLVMEWWERWLLD